MALTYVKDIPDFTKKVKDVTNINELELTVDQLSASMLEVQGDVTELELTVSQLSASMLEVQGDVTTLAGAVTSLDDEVETLKPKVISTFTKDGTTTYAEALASMFNTNINEHSVLIIDYGTQKHYFNLYRLTSTEAWFTSCLFGGTHTYINTLNVQSTNAGYNSLDIVSNTGSMSIVSSSTNIAENMQIINL